MSRTVLLLVLLQISFTVQDPLVKLPNGQVLGREATTAADNTYYAFEGIPYGAPPIRNFRFKAPQPAGTWKGTLNATTSDIICYSFPPMNGMITPGTPSETCLNLNVYTPYIPSSEDDDLLAVMVWIYGGAFIGGSTLEYYPDLFIDEGVILVAINYRTGIFGFISTQDEVIPGNAGLKDQALALQWVHDNIHIFGGDNSRVTIFGQSAGGGSCAYQLLNQNSLYLINGAILESGTFLSPGMFQRNPRPKAFGTAAILNSTFETSDDSEALLEFLLTVDADTLNEAAVQYADDITNDWDDLVEPGSKFAPVIEVKNPDAFLTKKQYGLLKAGNVLPVPTLMGFTSEEKIGMFQDEAALKELMTVMDQHLDYIVPDDMQITDVKSRTEMGTKIRDIYTGGKPFADNLSGALRYSSDNFLGRSMIKHAELFSSIAPTYFYQFSFDGELDHSDVQYEGAGNIGHGSELAYLFCNGADCLDTSDADLLTSQRIVKLWTNFAKYQNPTPEPSELLQNVTWPYVSLEDGDFFYLDIGENLEVRNHPKGDAYEKWVELYEGLGYDDFDSY